MSIDSKLELCKKHLEQLKVREISLDDFYEVYSEELKYHEDQVKKLTESNEKYRESARLFKKQIEEIKESVNHLETNYNKLFGNSTSK